MSIHYLFRLLIRGTRKPEQIPADFEQDEAYTQERSPIYSRVNAEIDKQPFALTLTPRVAS